MPPKHPPSPSSSSAASESTSAASSSDEEQPQRQQQQATQLARPLKNSVLTATTANKKPPAANDDSGSDEDEEEEEKDDDDDNDEEEASDDSASPPKPAAKPDKPAPASKAEAASAAKPPPSGSESESDDSDSDAKPPPPRRPDPSVKPITSKPIDTTPKAKKPFSEKPNPSAASAFGAEKRKRQEAEVAEQGDAAADGPSAKRGKKGSQKSGARPVAASPGKKRSGFAAIKRSVAGGEDAEGEAEILYPRLREAIRLLEEEDRGNLLKGSVGRALGLLKPAEAKALEERWSRHFVTGFKYFLERAKLKENLLKSLLEALESE